MTEIRRRFYYDETADSGERWLYLARDTESGDIWIVEGRAPVGEPYAETVADLAVYLAAADGPAKANLLSLIGSLIPEKGHKRPSDVIGNAVLVMRMLTGEANDHTPVSGEDAQRRGIDVTV